MKAIFKSYAQSKVWQLQIIPNNGIIRNAVIVLLFSLCMWQNSFALNAGSVSITLISGPNFCLDSNTPATAGPHAAYVEYKVTNISGATLNNLSITLGGFVNGVYLAGGQAATQYIGSIANGAFDNLYFFVGYPSTIGTVCSITATVSDLNPGTNSATNNITTISIISANAGGNVNNATLGPGYVVGQIVPLTVTYSFGNIPNGGFVIFQPSGAPTFNAGCFQLVNCIIVSSQINSINAGTTDQIFFTATAATSGTNNIVVVTYYFKNLCVNVGTTARPYAYATSGGQIKYTGNYNVSNINMPAASNAFTISKSESSSSITQGDTVTYTVTVRNTSAYASSFDIWRDILPPGFSYINTTSASQVNTSNSSQYPATNSTGTLTWKGGPAATVFPYSEYYVAANDSIKLIYKSKAPATAPLNTTATNYARIVSGRDSTALVSVSLCINCGRVLSGTVYDDANGTTNALIDGVTTYRPSSTQLYVSLVSQGTNIVRGVVPVLSNGTFSFDINTGLASNSNFNVILSTASPAVGAVLTTSTLPNHWVSTAEGVTGTGDGTINGIYPVSFVANSITNIKFGIDSLPVATSTISGLQVNAGGTTQYPLVNTSFIGSDHDGIVSFIHFHYPSNATTITINGTSYSAASFAAAFPLGYCTLAVNISGNPIVPITADPSFLGAGNIVAQFAYVDNAGYTGTSATATFPFIDLSIGGTVYDDANGINNLLIDGVPTNAANAQHLYMHLVSSNIVLAVQSLPANGQFLFGTANGIVTNSTYTFVLSTTQGTVGAPPPAAVLPTKWVNTAEGLSGLGDGTPDGINSVYVATDNLTNLNFGIDKAPNSTNQLYNISYFTYAGMNLVLTAANGFGSLQGIDLEDGTMEATYNFTITSLAGMNGNVLYYDANGDGIYSNAEKITAPLNIPNFVPSHLVMQLVNPGSVMSSFNYTCTDNAGAIDNTPAIYVITWPFGLPVQMVSFNATYLQQNNTVQLTWSTLSEMNSAFFVIERCNGTDPFTTIGTIKAAGFSNFNIDYSFIDENPAAGTNYYRLKQVDADSTFQYYYAWSIITTSQTQLPVVLFPNPASVGLHLANLSSKVSAQGISVLDTRGQDQTSNTQIIVSGTGQATININSLVPGQYILTISDNEHTQTYPFIKTN